MKKIIAIVLMAICLCVCMCGCFSTEAQKVNYNMNLEADQFNCERRITVYNARTDMVILELEGYMSLSNNSSSELVVTCKVGANEYKKNYIYLNDYTLYVVEDITGTHTDQYHYNLRFHTSFPVDIDIVP